MRYGEHAGELELVDGEVGAHGSLQSLVLGPELLALESLGGRDRLHGGHSCRGPEDQ